MRYWADSQHVALVQRCSLLLCQHHRFVHGQLHDLGALLPLHLHTITCKRALGSAWVRPTGQQGGQATRRQIRRTARLADAAAHLLFGSKGWEVAAAKRLVLETAENQGPGKPAT